MRCERPRGGAPSDCSDVYRRMEISYFDEQLVHEGAVVEDILVPHVMQPGMFVFHQLKFLLHHESLLSVFSFFSALQGCVYTVDVASAADRESTYHIWEAMVALDDMCARFGRIGTAYGLGLSACFNVCVYGIASDLLLGRDGKVIVELNSRNTPTISNS